MKTKMKWSRIIMIAGFIAIVVAFILAQYELKKDILDLQDQEPEEDPKPDPEPETIDVEHEEIKDVTNEPGANKTE
jgi:hypothetical protein